MNMFNTEGGGGLVIPLVFFSIFFFIPSATIKDYSHFCNHPRNPGEGCKKCKSCSLWTNPKEDDDRAIKEIQERAEQEKEEKGYVNDRRIGVVNAPGASGKINVVD